MNRQASILLNNISSSIGGDSFALQDVSAQRSYYQRLIHSLLSCSIRSADDFQSLGKKLADVARHADFAKQTDAVEQATQIMLALPISAQLRSVARHYQALCLKLKGDYEDARRLLERVVEKATPQYKARALQVIGATYYEQGKLDAALPFYLAAGKIAISRDPLTLIASQQMIAVVRSIHGDHKQALDDLERLFPLARAIGKYYPAFYYDYLNSLAVELGEVGRIDEAKAACAITLASPFSAAYPNWAETRDEIEAKRTRATPSIVAVTAAPSPLAQTKLKIKPIRLVAFCWPSRKKVFIQRAITAIVATARIARIEFTRSILERVHYSITSRGPPSRF